MKQILDTRAGGAFIFFEIPDFRSYRESRASKAAGMAGDESGCNCLRCGSLTVGR